MAIGRPSKRTEKIEQRVIDGLSSGTPLTVICQPSDMPCDDTVRNWAESDATFSRDIARARDTGFDAIAWRLRETSRGRGDSTGDVVRDKLIIETDLKLLAKWDPKRYAELNKSQLMGEDGGPVKIESTRSEAEKAEFMAMLAKAREG
jgi:hypothetical protein